MFFSADFECTSAQLHKEFPSQAPSNTSYPFFLITGYMLNLNVNVNLGVVSFPPFFPHKA